MARQFLTAIDLAKNELQNAAIQNLAGAPSTPVKGQLYYNTSDNTLYWWNGTAWVSASGGGSGFPGYGSVPAETTFGLAKADGVATTVARSDHTHGSPTHDASAHSTIPLNTFAVPTGPIAMNSQRITGLGTPSAAQDGATKSYVDNLIQGLSWKDSVKAASTANVALTGTQTIDGIALVAQDRVLLKDQTAPAENGIWAVAAGTWSRVTDADSEADLLNATVWVEQGTTLADTGWTMTTNGPITVGTTALTWVQSSGAGQLVAGNGLTLTGNILAVGSSATITATADVIAVNPDSITNAHLADVASYTLKGNNTAGTANPSDLTAAQVMTMLANQAGAAKKYATNTVGGATSQNIAHNLGSLYVAVQVFRNSSPWDTIECDVERVDSNNITLRFATAPAANAYSVVVVG